MTVITDYWKPKVEELQQALQAKDAEIAELRKQHDAQVRAIFDEIEQDAVNSRVFFADDYVQTNSFDEIKKKYLGEAKKE